MNIDHKSILDVYRKNNEELTYQAVCLRLAIEKLEAQSKELQARVDKLEGTTEDGSK